MGKYIYLFLYLAELYIYVFSCTNLKCFLEFRVEKFRNTMREFFGVSSLPPFLPFFSLSVRSHAIGDGDAEMYKLSVLP